MPRPLQRIFLLLVMVLAGRGLDAETVRPLASETPDGFPVPRPGWRPEFPRSNASHPEFRIEWWYVTGHLYGPDRDRYGFQVTFFRTAAPGGPGRDEPVGVSFGHSQLHLAHMALTEVASGRFLHQELLNREGWDADAATDRLDVRNGSWRLREVRSGESGHAEFEIVGGVRAEARFRLRLVSEKPPVTFGTDGVSRKGADTTAASHYLTYTRLKVDGTLALDGRETFPVTGQAWFDHEISSSQLDAEQSGWDWASLQLDDGRELMAYILRRKDGSVDPFSTLAWIDRSGAVRHFGPDSFRWEPLRWWTSPDTGGRYPISVRIRAPDPDDATRTITFTLDPLADRQELRGAVGGVPYWEGPCRVMEDDGKIVGSAYLELTGYTGDLSGVLAAPASPP